MEDTKFYFAVSLWGDEYLSMFLDYVLPSQLADGNLPAILQDHPSEYAIFAKSQEVDRIRSHWAYIRLTETIPTTIFDVAVSTILDAHSNVRGFHYLASDWARQKAEYLFFLPPDFIWANHSFANVGKIVAEENPNLLFLTSIRSDKNKFLKALDDRFEPQTEGKIEISSSELVSLNFQYIHRCSKLFTWGNIPNVSVAPQHLYFMAGEHACVARGFYLHPLVMRLPHGINLADPLDPQFLQRAYRNLDKISVVSDSDIAYAAHMTETERDVVEVRPSPQTPHWIWDWAERHTNRVHRRIFDTMIYIRGSDGENAIWSEAIALCNEVHAEVCAKLESPTREQMRKDPSIINARTRQHLLKVGFDPASMAKLDGLIALSEYYFARAVIWTLGKFKKFLREKFR